MAFTTAPSLSVIFPCSSCLRMPEVTKRWKKTLFEQKLCVFEAGSTSQDKFRQARANPDRTFIHMLGSYQESTLSCHTAVHKCTNFLSPYFDKECSTRPGHQDSVQSQTIKGCLFYNSQIEYFGLNLTSDWTPRAWKRQKTNFLVFYTWFLVTPKFWTISVLHMVSNSYPAHFVSYYTRWRKTSVLYSRTNFCDICSGQLAKGGPLKMPSDAVSRLIWENWSNFEQR